MNAWTLESMNKSILFDVLSVIDQASKYQDDMAYLMSDFSLLKKDTIQMYMRIYEVAGKYDDAISSAMYIPVKNNPYNWTLLFDKLSMVSNNFNCFEDLITFLRTEDSIDSIQYFLRGCLREEQKIVPEEIIEKMIDTRDLMSISVFEKTHLPQKIKFSLSTLLLNYTEYIELLITFLSKVHTVVQEMYERYKPNYRYAVRTLKAYLDRDGMDKLLDEYMWRIISEKKIKKYIIVLSLLRPEYADVIFGEKKLIMICGPLYVQRILHDEHFELF